MRIAHLIILFILFSSVFVISDTEDFVINHGNNQIIDDRIDFNNRGFYTHQDYIDLFGGDDDFKIYINTVNGNLYHRRLDFEAEEAGIPIRIIFTYNSGSSFSGNFGNHWQFNYNIRYSENNLNNHKIIVYPDDRTSLYKFNKKDSTYSPHLFNYDSLFNDSKGNLIFRFDAGILTDKRNRLSANLGNDSNFSVKTLSDDYGNSLNFNYTDDSKLKTIQYPSGKTVILEYDSEFLSRIILPGGKEISYNYNSEGNLDSLHLPTDKYILYEYDECGYLTKIITELNEISIAYDDDFRVSAIINHFEDLIYKLQYDTVSRKTTLILPDNSIKNYFYDSKERSIEYRYGNFSLKKSWNDYNQISQITDGLGNITRYNYDIQGRPTLVTYPDNLISRYNWNNSDNSLTYINRAGASSNYYFDAHGNIIKYINSLGEVVDIIRYNQGDVSDFIFSDELRVSLYRDNLTRIRQLRINGSEHLVLDYNLDDELSSIKDVFGNITHFSFDPSKRIISIDYPNGSNYGVFYLDNSNQVIVSNRIVGVSDYQYDPIGRIIELKKDGENPMNFVYSSFRNFNFVFKELNYALDFGINRKPEKIQMPDNKMFEFKYDGNNNITSLNYNSLIHSFKYNSLSQVAEYINPNGYIRKYSYSPLGKVNSFSNETGKTTLIYYDIHGRETRKTIGGLSIYYEYVSDREVKINFDDLYSIRKYYNALGQLVEEKTEGSDNFFYGYDNAGNLIEITKNNLHTTKLKYDNSYNLVNVLFPNSYNLSLNYSSGNLLVDKSDNMGLSSHYSYDKYGRFIEITDETGKKRVYKWNEFNNLLNFKDKSLNDYTFEYSNDDMKIKYPNNSLATYKFTGFLNDRLLTSVENNGSIRIRFNYDKSGNFISSTDDYAEQILVEYNNDNSPAQITNPKDETHQFTYDFLGRIINIRNPENNNNSFQYDALSHITKITDYSGLIYQLSHRTDGKLLNVQSQDFKIQYTYNSENKLSLFSHYDTELLRFQYSGENISKIISKNKDSINLSYDLLNRLKTKENESGIVFTYFYEPNGYLNKISSSGGNQLKFERDNSDNILNISIDDHQIGQFNYNNIGLITNINTLDTLISISYNALGDIVQLNESGGIIYQLTNDILGRHNSIRHPDNRRELFAYDSKGNIKTYTSFDAQSHEYEYNYRNQLTKNKWSRIDSIGIDYSPDGNIISISDPLNIKREFNWTSGKRINRINLFGSGNTFININDGQSQNRQINILIGIGDTLNYSLDHALRYNGIARDSFRKISYNNSGIQLNKYQILNDINSEKNENYGISNNKYSYLKTNGDSVFISYPANSLIPSNLKGNFQTYHLDFTNKFKINTFKDFKVNYTIYNNYLSISINPNNVFSFTYNDSKLLTSLNNNQEYLLLLNYNNSNYLESVADNLNNGFILNYDNNGNVRAINKSDKWTFEYLYDNNSNLIINKNESFDESSYKYFNNLPVVSDFPDLSSSTFAYNKWLNTSNIKSTKTTNSEMFISNNMFGSSKSFSINYNNQFTKSFSNKYDNTLKINDLLIRDIVSISSNFTEIKTFANQIIKIQSISDTKSVEFPGGISILFDKINAYSDNYIIKNTAGNTIANYEVNYVTNNNKSDLLSISSSGNNKINMQYDFRGRLNQYISNTDAPVNIDYHKDWRISEISTSDVTTLRDYDASNRLIRNGNFNIGYDIRGNVISKSVGIDTVWFIYNFENLLTGIVNLEGDTTKLIYSPRSSLIGIISAQDSISILPSDEKSKTKFPHIRAYMDSKGNLLEVFDYFEVEGVKLSYNYKVKESKSYFQVYTQDNNQFLTVDNTGTLSFTKNLVTPIGGLQEGADNISLLSFNEMLYIPKLKLFFDGKRFYDPDLLDFLQESNFHRTNPYNSNPLKLSDIAENKEQFAIPIETLLPIYHPFNNRFTNIENEINPYKIIEKELNDHFNNFKNFRLTTKVKYDYPTLNITNIEPITPISILSKYSNPNGIILSPKLPESLLDTMLLRQNMRIIPEDIKRTPTGNELEILKGYIMHSDIPKCALIFKIIDRMLEIQNPVNEVFVCNIINESPVKPDLETIEIILSDRNLFRKVTEQNLIDYTKDFDAPLNKISVYLPKIGFDNGYEVNDVLSPNRFMSQVDDNFFAPKQLFPKLALFSERILRENLTNFLDDALSIKPENLFPGRTLYRQKYLPLPYSIDYENNIPGVYVRKKSQNFDLEKK